MFWFVVGVIVVILADSISDYIEAVAEGIRAKAHMIEQDVEDRKIAREAANKPAEEEIA